jgi:predicted nucleic acid-binding protein
LIQTAVDTSLLVAALLPWHDSHQAASRALETIMTEEGAFVLPLPALIEAYSVLTRMPAPHRLSPRDVFSMLTSILLDTARIVSLDGHEAWPFLAAAVAAEAAGGGVYDAQILACARKAGVKRIFTLNERDFKRLRPEGFRVEIPA